MFWGLNPSQPHPEPWTATEADDSCFLNSSNEPKFAIKAFSKSPKNQNTNFVEKELLSDILN